MDLPGSLHSLAYLMQITYLLCMSDRLLGYSVITFIVLFLLTPAAYLIYKSTIPGEIRTVRFQSLNSLNFLSIQDPVRMQGVEIGAVKSIREKDKEVFVKIETFHPLTIHEGYKITASMKGLLGDRFLTINPGDLSRTTIDKDQILTGHFTPGLADVISQFELLRSGLHDLGNLVQLLKDGSEKNAPLVSIFTKVATRFDSVSSTVLQFANDLDRSIDHDLHSLSVTLAKTESFSHDISVELPKLLKKIEMLAGKTNDLLLMADSLITKSDKAVAWLTGPEITTWGDDLRKLQVDLRTVRSFIKEIQSDGLKLPVRLW